VITSGSRTEEFEICGSGTYYRGIWFPEYGYHVTDRHSTRSAAGGAPRLAVAATTYASPYASRLPVERVSNGQQVHLVPQRHVLGGLPHVHAPPPRRCRVVGGQHHRPDWCGGRRERRPKRDTRGARRRHAGRGPLITQRRRCRRGRAGPAAPWSRRRGRRPPWGLVASIGAT